MLVNKLQKICSEILKDSEEAQSSSQLLEMKHLRISQRKPEHSLPSSDQRKPLNLATEKDGHSLELRDKTMPKKREVDSTNSDLSLDMPEDRREQELRKKPLLVQALRSSQLVTMLVKKTHMLKSESMVKILSTERAPREVSM